MTSLSAATLPALPAAVATPAYDRGTIATSVVHFGVGGFHRAHQAMYHDRLMNAGEGLDWGICGVGVLAGDAAMKEALEPQDHLYTLVVKHADGTDEPRVIGALTGYRFAPEDPEAVVEQMADPATRIVSLTVTEGGYDLDPDAPDIRHDLQPGAAPRTVFGLVVEALRRRHERGAGPFTVMSCDNLPGNGHVARAAFSGFARLRDAELADWIEREVRFPNSMVDRITPGTTDADREALRERFGVEDRWPVVCEDFTQWVLEDDFAAGRPPYEDAGVQIVDDVEPYELMKLRLLNAGHQALAYFGVLSGYELVHDAAQDPLFQALLRGYMDEEATPTLAPVPGIDLEDYKRTLIERFSNPQVGDTLARLAFGSSDRMPKFVLPVVHRQVETGGPVRYAAAIVASWARYAEGVDEQGEPIEVVDAQSERLRAVAARNRDDPLAFLSMRELFGDLADDERFVEAYRWALGSLHERGARATLAALTGR